MSDGSTLPTGPKRVTLLVGPSGARLDDAARRYAENGGLGDSPGDSLLGPRTWIAANGRSASAAKERLVRVATETAGGGWLSPGVRTVRRAADALVGASSPDVHPLGSVAKREIVAEVVRNAIAASRSRDTPHPLAELGAAPGLVDHLVRRFVELASMERPAGAIKSMLRAEGPVGLAIHDLWGRYREALDKHALLDAEGRVDLAAQLWAESTGSLATLVVELAAIRTPLEQRLVRGFADRAQSVVLLAPGDRASVAAALDPSFAPVTRLPASGARVAPWAAAFPGELSIEEVGVTRATPAALRRVAAELFADGPTVERELDLAPGAVEVLVGTNEQDATHRAARRVKELLHSGVAKPHEVVVTARRFPDRGRRIAEGLAEYGVPVALGPPAQLGDAAVVGALIDVLSVATSDWGYDELLRAVCRSDLAALDASPEGRDRANAGSASERGLTEWFLRELQAPAGRRYVLGHAAAVAASQPLHDDEDDQDHDAAGPSRRVVAARAARGLLGRLAAALDSLPTSATPLGWFDASNRALASLGYAPASRADSPGVRVVEDSAALEALEAAAAEVEHLAALRGRPAPTWDLRAWLAALREWRTRLPVRANQAAESVVRIEPADVAATVGAPWVVVVGLDELSFAGGPSAPAVSAEPADSATATPQDEAMLGFYDLVTSAEQGLVLCYAGLDARAQPLEPSPFVADVERLFAPGSLRRGGGPLADAPPLSLREWRRSAVRAAIGGDAKPLAACLAATGSAAVPLVAGLDAIAQRSRGEAFGPFEGSFGASASAAAGLLAERYGRTRLWSASQLETYAECPFKFFAR
ncbi:MAG: hypothetical protein ACRCT8_06545, partial [Lacipirellulaceae bacterium]